MIQQNYLKGSECITIGSDPELEVYDHNFKLIKADSVLSTRLNSQIGCDGYTVMAELRPHYSTDPLEHVENIKKLIKRLKTKNIKALSTANKYYCGGHVHFNIDLYRNEKLRNDLIGILDLFSIFMIKFENEKHARYRRLDAGYGKLGDYEYKKHGGFEYRTLSCWLNNPMVARGVLCISYILAHETLYNINHIKKMLKTFRYKFKNRREFNTKFNDCDYSYFTKDNFNFYSYFYKNLKRCLLYDKYKPYVDSLYSLIKLNKRVNNNNIIKSWGLENYELFIYAADYVICDLKHVIENKSLKLYDIKKNNYSLFKIYGLKRGRDIDISSNNDTVLNLINLYLKISNKKLNVANLNPFGYNSIGFGYELRNNDPELIKSILEFIKTNHKKIKGGSNYYGYSYEKPIFSENNICRECGNSFDDCCCEREEGAY